MSRHWRLGGSGGGVAGAVVLGFMGFSSLVGLSVNVDTKCEQCSCQVLVFSHGNSQTPPSAPAPAARPVPPPAPAPGRSAPRTAQERVREEMTARPSPSPGRRSPATVGRRSLRSIARHLGMAPSALYRYSTAGTRCSRRSSSPPRGAGGGGGAGGRSALRGGEHGSRRRRARSSWRSRAPFGHWALEHPHQWG